MAADWWALGVVCFECLTDGLPFPFAEDDATQSPAHVLECIARRVHTYKMAEGPRGQEPKIKTIKVKNKGENKITHDCGSQ